MSNTIQVGGQAVIEGVMMQTPGSLAVVVRKRNGELKIKREHLDSFLSRIPFRGKPFLRGILALVTALIKGMEALSYSAQQCFEDEAGEAPESLEKAPGRWIISLFLAIGVGCGILLFVVLPHALTALLGKIGNISMGVETISFHLVDGVLKISFFLLYIWGISLIKDIRRVFQYHGAEHKAIGAYEAGQPLTLEAALPFSTIHRRCGTAFIMLVLAISIVLFSIAFPLVPGFRSLSIYETHIVAVVIKIMLFIPLTGITYEVIRAGDRYPQNVFLQALTRPGLWLQRMTTREPTAEQLEVALTALKSALEMEQNRMDLSVRGHKDA